MALCFHLLTPNALKEKKKAFLPEQKDMHSAKHFFPIKPSHCPLAACGCHRRSLWRQWVLMGSADHPPQGSAGCPQARTGMARMGDLGKIRVRESWKKTHQGFPTLLGSCIWAQALPPGLCLSCMPSVLGLVICFIDASLDFPAWPQACLVAVDLPGHQWALSWPQSSTPSQPGSPGQVPWECIPWWVAALPSLSALVSSPLRGARCRCSLTGP